MSRHDSKVLVAIGSRTPVRSARTRFSSGRNFRRLTFLAATSFLLACAPAPRNPFERAVGGKQGGSGTRHRVQFEVMCRECVVSWRVGMDAGTDQDRGSWSRSVSAYSDLGETVATLSATPTQGAGPVSWVRIRVDGKIVAEKRNDEDAGAAVLPSRRSLSVEAVIPHLPHHHIQPILEVPPCH